MRISSLSIRWQLAGLAAAAVVPLAVLTAYDLHSDSVEHVARETEASRRIASRSARSLAQFLDDQRAALKLLAQRGPDLLDPAICAALAKNFVSLNPKYANLVVRDAQDRAVCGARARGGLPEQALDPESFQRALREARFVVGAPVLGPISRSWVAILRHPIVDGAGKPIGVINLPIDLARLQSLVSQAELPIDGTLDVVARDGTVVTRAPDSEAWVGRNVRGLGTIDELLRSSGEAVRGSRIDGVESVLGIAPVPHSDWIVVSSIPISTVLAPARRALQRNLVVLLLVIATSAAMTLALARSIDAPVRKLALIADEAARSGLAGDRVEETGPHEIATVSKAFNRMLDIRAKAEADLRASEQRYRLAASSGDVWDADVQTGKGQMPLNFKRALGYEDAEVEGRFEVLASLMHPDDAPRWKRVLTDHLARGEPYELEFRARSKTGEYRWFETRGQAMRDADGRPTYMAGTVFDITERKTSEARVTYLATHDGLTDLPNRNLMEDRISQALHHARRAVRPVALMFVDLDRFKLINDGYGHPFGDEVLKAAARRLGAAVREGDTVARHSGDEFLVLLVDLRKPADAQIVAQKMREAFEKPFQVEGREIYVTASLGVSVFPQDGADAATLIRNADAAMQQAKRLGKSTYQFFTPAMNQEAQGRVELETQLRGALANDELRLVFQPKVDLASGRMSGCEALLRWHPRQSGPISPARFIPIAEDTGLIVPIGDWVLRTACSQAKAWRSGAGAPIMVSVNVSARQFLQQDVVGWVLNGLAATGYAPAQLELELTESVIAQNPDRVIRVMHELKAEGVKLSVDDFGTGYSSLSYLKRFPVDALKIDQSFIRNMLTEPKDAAIARSTIALAHSLGLTVVAEGVETAEHCAYLKQHGCDVIQGYYFSKPIPAEDFEALLASDRRLPATQRA